MGLRWDPCRIRPMQNNPLNLLTCGWVSHTTVVSDALTRGRLRFGNFSEQFELIRMSHRKVDAHIPLCKAGPA